MKKKFLQGYLYEIFPFPCLYKYISYPHHESLLAFSQPIIQQTKDIIMNEWKKKMENVI